MSTTVATAAAVAGMNATIISNNMMQSAGDGGAVISPLVLFVVLLFVTGTVGCVCAADAKLNRRFASTREERVMFHNKMMVRGIITVIALAVEILLMILVANM